jgi:hypothetical protein
MVKQRNIFEPNRIDILTDEKEELTPDKLFEHKQIIELHNAGVKVFGKPKSRRKGYQDTPLFQQVNNEKQMNMF